MNKKKKIELGKIDLFNHGRKICPVTVEIELRDDKQGRPEFSASAMVWNQCRSDAYIAGQCLDDIYPYLRNNKTFVIIYGLWKRNHLNGMHAGTEVQEYYLDSILSKMKVNRDYNWQCKYLREMNLLYDHGYKYGTSWLYQEISNEDMEQIEALIA